MFIIDNMWLIFLGSSNQAEWSIKQVSHDQQLGEQDQPPQETWHYHPGRGDRPLPRLHDLVHVRLSSTLHCSLVVGTRWMTAFVIFIRFLPKFCDDVRSDWPYYEELWIATVLSYKYKYCITYAALQILNFNEHNKEPTTGQYFILFILIESYPLQGD